MRCHPAKGCGGCRLGWEGANCTQPIDMCRQNVSRCQPEEVCVDIVGSYRCECQEGYIRRHDGICGNYLTTYLLFIYDCYRDFMIGFILISLFQ